VADESQITAEGAGDATATRFGWADASPAEADDDRPRVLHAEHQGIALIDVATRMKVSVHNPGGSYESGMFARLSN
jgi:hypothetical protein